MASESYTRLMQTLDAQRPVREAFSQSLTGVRQAMASFEGRYPPPEDVVVTSVLAGAAPAEFVDAPNALVTRVILYIHGGCYISGSPRTVRECCAHLSRAARARVLSVDYRLAPEHPFPAALDDVLDAYAWLLDQGHDPANICLSGESAGGGLTIAALLRIRDEGRLPMPALAVPVSPWVDMTLSGQSLTRNVGRDIASTVPLAIGAKAYVGGGDPRGPYVSPIFASLQGLPPMLIQVGGGEVLLDDAIAIAHIARRDGVDLTFEVWPDMFHVWHWFASELDEGRDAIKAIGAFIESRLS